MGFVATKTGETVMGNKRVVHGAYTNDTTGGDIATGLHHVEHFSVDGCVSSSVSGGTITVVMTASNAGARWMAWGED